MKVMIAALALSVLAIGVAPAQIQLRIATETTAPSKTPQSETTGGNKRNPEPHIYKLGEHLSEAYGGYQLVDDWKTAKLAMPPEGHHWVRYGENYLLVTATDGLITRIVHAG